MIDYRWMALFDSHGDMIDQAAADVAFEFAEHFKPDLRIGGGDHFDFRWLRRGASEEEKYEEVLHDFKCGMEFLAQWRPHVRLIGNHDWRLNRTLADPGASGKDRALAQMLTDQISERLPRHEVLTWCKRRGVYRLGDYAVIHGYASGKTMTRQHANIYGNVIHGHGHRVEWERTSRHDGAVGYQAGCLCRLDMDYNRGQLATLAQRHGFAYGYVTKAGKTTVWLACEEDDGTWILPSEFTSLSSTRSLSQPSNGSPKPPQTETDQPGPSPARSSQTNSDEARPTPAPCSDEPLPPGSCER